MLIEVTIPNTGLEDSLRRRRQLEGQVELHSVEFDEVGLETLFRFYIDDENFYDLADPQEWVQEYAEEMVEDTLL